jgi:hypothetical protein
LTAATTELLLKTELLTGVMYPAVAKAARADNLALRPEFVRNGMRLEEAVLVRVEQVQSNGSVLGVRVATLSGVSGTGKLSWEFANERSSLAGGSLQIPENGQVLAVSPALLVAGDIQYRIEPGYLIGIDGNNLAVTSLRGEPASPIVADGTALETG